MARFDPTDHVREDMTEDEKIIQEAKDRFKKCEEWESDFRRLYVADRKFANGDSDNGWQWPDDLRKDREANKRPALTINRVAQYVALITNNARQNKPSINIKPMGQEASYDAAQVLEGLVRHIEYISSAQNIYDDATESQVEGGVGYWRVIQQYTDDDSFDQELLIAPVDDHLGVLLDCDIKQKDGSDAKYCFLFGDVPRKEFNEKYSDHKDASANTGLGDVDDWIKDGNIRVAEYYRIEEIEDQLIHMEDEQGGTVEFKQSEVPEKYRKRFIELGENVKKRKIWNKKLEWYKIAGSKIIDRRTDLKGKYVPVIRVIGKERIIDGRLERKGHVRALKDAQRMYNYNTSAQVEFGALQTKSPYLVATAAIGTTNVTAWNNLNRNNPAYLPWEHKDSDGQPVPEPKRSEPPGIAPAFIEGMKIASAEMEIASGQHAAQPDTPQLERTPQAIDARERKGETATYHFIDNLAIAIRYTGRIILDLVPHIYDTERVIQILGKDGSQQNVRIQPDLKQAYILQAEQQEVSNILFNPKVGKYEVESDVGPAYASQRQEAWNAFVNITSGNPELINVIGDLMFMAGDFPLADKIAERIKRQIRATAPWLLEDQPGPVIAQLNKTIDDQAQKIAELLEKLAHEKIKIKGKAELRDIEEEDAKTRRLTALGNVVSDFERLGLEKTGLDREIRQTFHDMEMDHVDRIQEANKAEIEGQQSNE